MTVKLLANAMAAAALAGAAAVGMTAVLSGPAITHASVQPAVFGSPMPLDPVDVVPTADQLNGVLSSLADPGVPFASKSYLVEGGLGRLEARTADALMRNAVARGQVPLSFAIGNILPAGPGAATASVTATGPNMPATTQSVTFVDQGGWKLSRASASSVLAMFSA